MAPLTTAERKQRSRQKQNEEKKNKERERSKLLMQNLRKSRKSNKKLKNKEKEASKVRMRKMRQKKEEEKLSVSTENVFPTRQSFGKALKKTNTALPQSPRKKVAVINKIASDLGLVLQNPKLPNKNSMPDDTKQKVIDFYYNDVISRILPGKKDVKSVKNPLTNKRIKLQKRLLMLNLKEVYQLFKTENSDEKIGLAKFCELRPAEVQTVGSKDHDMCCCPYCENINFLLAKCKWKTIEINTASDLIALIVCDKYNADCMKKKCLKCEHKFKNLIVSEMDLNDENIVIDQWNGGKLEQKMFSVNSFQEETIKQITKMADHIYNIQRQARELRKEKDALEEGDLLLQVDFAENYSIKHQNEVMAAHWKTAEDATVSIYTAVAYYRKHFDDDLEIQSYAVISDTKTHSCNEVKIFNDAIIKDYKENLNTQVNKVFVWSDGAASQFKSRYTMGLMSADNIYSEWNFSESYHGKGPHDGVGAALKHHVWKKVLQKQIIVKTANDFYTEVKSALNVRCLLIPEFEITNKVAQLEVLTNDFKPLVGIKSAHCIKTVSKFCVDLFTNTGDSVPFAKGVMLKIDASISEDTKTFELEKYYGVFYDDNWYIGRVIEYDRTKNSCRMKFLRENDLGFYWPKPEDFQFVDTKFILSGPIELQGNHPFHISYPDRKKLIMKYKEFKKLNQL